MLRLRVRSKIAGVSNLTVDGDLSLLKFAQLLQDTTGIPYCYQKLLTGFPPVPLDKALPHDLHVPISSLFHTGDVITVEESANLFSAHSTSDQPASASLPQQLQQQLHQPQQPLSVLLPLPLPPYQPPAPPIRGSVHRITEGGVVRRKIADDNSCLFNAVGYVLESDPQGRAKQLRALVAHVVTHSENYTEAMLGKPKTEYASWITMPNSWGGGIEVAILSQEYQTEICTFDVLSKTPLCYGEGQGFVQKVFLIYDGLHYDALAINLLAEEEQDHAPAELDITLFEPEDEGVQSKMAAFVDQVHKAGQFTNMATFQLKCGECDKVLRGEKEMAMHAAATGHGTFAEVNK